MIDACREKILDDVVRVDMVLASECEFDVPCQVCVTTMAGTKSVGGETADRVGAASLSVAYNVQDGDDGLMEDAPKLTRTPKTTAAGLVNALTLEVPIAGGFETTRKAAELLHRQDFHVVLTTADGTRYLLYSLPGSCECMLKGTDINQQDTLTASMQSMSQMIRLTESDDSL